jgi:hypothetical protein
MFENLNWETDRILLNGLVLRLEPFPSDEDWNEDYFRFYKDKQILDEYERFWLSAGQFRPQNMVELGIWDGGSIALWFECWQPKKLVGIDLQEKGDSKYFQRYITSNRLGENIKTYWRTDQSDSKRLREIIDAEFSMPLDLVIDDASHLYEQTKASFECLFPLLRPGGFYIIEDWAWSHWPEYQDRKHPYFGGKVGLTNLVFELVEATGTRKQIIRDLRIFHGFAAIERGDVGQKDLSDFRLENWISRRRKEPFFVRHLKNLSKAG